MALKEAYLGSRILIAGENTTVGMPLIFRASAANLPPSGAQPQFQPYLFQRKAGPAAGRVEPLPRSANTAVGKMGLKVTGDFLWHRLFCMRGL